MASTPLPPCTYFRTMNTTSSSEDGEHTSFTLHSPHTTLDMHGHYMHDHTSTQDHTLRTALHQGRSLPTPTGCTCVASILGCTGAPQAKRAAQHTCKPIETTLPNQPPSSLACCTWQDLDRLPHNKPSTESGPDTLHAPSRDSSSAALQLGPHQPIRNWRPIPK